MELMTGLDLQLWLPPALNNGIGSRRELGKNTREEKSPAVESGFETAAKSNDDVEGRKRDGEAAKREGKMWANRIILAGSSSSWAGSRAHTFLFSSSAGGHQKVMGQTLNEGGEEAKRRRKKKAGWGSSTSVFGRCRRTRIVDNWI
jgi:hypothetical protein